MPARSSRDAAQGQPARKILRSIHEGARDMARDFAKTDAYVTSRRERKKVEMLFAHLKRILKLDRLRLRGPNGAKDEFLLAATAQNLRKLAKLILHRSRRPPPDGMRIHRPHRSGSQSQQYSTFSTQSVHSGPSAWLMKQHGDDTDPRPYHDDDCVSRMAAAETVSSHSPDGGSACMVS